MNELNTRICSIYPEIISSLRDKEYDELFRQKIAKGFEAREFKDWAKKKGGHCLLNVPPMFYPPFATQRILSVGLNPSLTLRIFNELPTNENVPPYGEEQIDELVAFQRGLKFGPGQINYFDQQHGFFQELGIANIEDEVFHYDLIQLRHTNASRVVELLRDGENNELRDAAMSHFEFVVASLKPSIIFVFNAKVSYFVSEVMADVTSGFDSTKGCYDFMGIPLILANQLSGGATSRFFRELLIWNSRRIWTNVQ